MLSNSLKEEAIAAVGVASKAATAIQIVSVLYEKVTGNAYGAADIVRLDELKRVYKDCLKREAPTFWN